MTGSSRSCSTEPPWPSLACTVTVCNGIGGIGTGDLDYASYSGAASGVTVNLQS